MSFPYLKPDKIEWRPFERVLQHAAPAIEEEVQADKEGFQIVVDDTAELIVAIWRLEEKTKTP
ncbi:hypothetical protein BYT27DRAFT_7257025 [Phlegmacium glaucopus]|nr:hypothetical protein BYT27DRAFT_7257025 [Phlegmacium glaucopus]